MTTRLRRAGAALAATSALTFGVTACGGGDAPATAVAPAAAPAATASPTATASTLSPAATAGAAPVGLDDCQDNAPLDPSAVSTFGAAEVRNAYCTAVAITLDTSYRSELVHYNPSKPHQASEFPFATQYMTSSSAQDWTKNVAAALATETSDDDGPVNALTLFDGYYESPDAGVLTTSVQGPAAGDLVVTPDHVTLNRTQEFGDRLEVALTLTGNLLLAKPDGSTLYAPTVKTITYWMASGSNPTAPWLIDGLSGNIHFNGVSDTRPTPAATVPPTSGS